jgi:uncharacterized protein (TIGR02679 family)
LFGDAHALDAGTARATLAVRAATRLAGVPFEDDAEGRRSAWASVGIYLDELSTPALLLNLPASSDSALARLLRTASLAGEPLHLSLRWLMRDPLDHDQALAHRTVFVCENPTIVALAGRQLGCQCAPLVCVNGRQPATPVKILLRQLVTAGARLRYHGDLDGKGIEIAIIIGYGAEPWRMGVDDYLAAPKGKALKQPPLGRRGAQRHLPISIPCRSLRHHPRILRLDLRPRRGIGAVCSSRKIFAGKPCVVRSTARLLTQEYRGL